MTIVAVEQLVERLHTSFSELAHAAEGTWLVGGALRDLLNGGIPADVDLVTRGARGAAEVFAQRTGGTFVDLGRDAFETLRVVTSGRIYDFSEMSGATIEDDLGRRDFTMNAIALELPEGRHLVDPFDGRRDLDSRRVRMVSEQNLVDDPLRIVKGIRTAALNDFDVDHDTLEAFRRHAKDVDRVAAERVSAELTKMLSGLRAARALDLLASCSVDLVILDRSVTPEELRLVASAGDVDPVTVFALLFRGRTAAEIDLFASRWKWSDAQRREVARLVEFLSLLRERPDLRTLRIAAYDAAAGTVKRAAAVSAATGDVSSASRLREIVHEEGFFETTPLADGREIEAITGIAPGRELGVAKRRLLEAQLAGEVRNREEAVAFLRSLK